MSSSGALFGSSAVSSRTGGGTTSGKNLIEFRAGKMDLKGRMVHPDKRKGLLYVYQSDDVLMHLCWKDRSKSTPEDDLIIFPDDTEFKHVPQCTTGRVYLLKFKSNSRKLFFWLQEPKTDKDDENCRRLNEVLNNPPTPGSARGGAGVGGGLSGIPGLPPEIAASLGADTDLQSLLSGMNQQQLIQLLGGMGGLSSLMSGRSSSSSVTDSNPPSRIQSSPGARPGLSSADNQASQPSAPPPRPVTAAGALQTSQPETGTSGRDSSQSIASSQGSSARIQLSDLQNILSSFSAGGGAAEGASEPKEVDLSSSLNSELLIPLLANHDIQERLAPFLPQGESLPSSEEELRQTVHSPQFRQAVQSFSAAFSSCQLGPLISQFGLGEAAVAAANVGDVTAFAKALQDKHDEKKKAEEDEEKDKPMDEDK